MTTQEQTMTDYDILIIGSSPMSLVEASLKADEGYKVCLVEGNDRLGGAWATVDCFNLTGIEASPHVFMPDQIAYDVIFKFLPYEHYETLEVQPKLMIRSSKTLGDFKLIYMWQRYKEAAILALISKFENKKGNPVSRAWEATTYFNYIRAYRKKNKQTVKLMYPKYGLGVWLKHCEKTLKDKGVVIKKSTQIQHITSEDNSGCIYAIDQDDNKYKANKLCYSDQMIVDSITIGKEKINLSYSDDTSDHLLFIVDGDFSTKPLGFWRIMKDSYLMFVNDITDYSPEFKELYPGKKLINARVTAYRSFTPKTLNSFFSHLAYIGYAKNLKLIDWHHTYTHRKKLTYEMRYRLKKLFKNNAYELESGTVGLHNGLRSTYGKYLKQKQEGSGNE